MASAVDVSYEVAGAQGAPVLVLSNSLGSTGAMWDPQVTTLAERLRVVRYDHRGHGGSPVPPGPYELADLGADALALLDRLGVQRTHWCGLSLAEIAREHLTEAEAARVLDPATYLGATDQLIDRALAAHANRS